MKVQATLSRLLSKFSRGTKRGKKETGSTHCHPIFLKMYHFMFHFMLSMVTRNVVILVLVILKKHVWLLEWTLLIIHEFSSVIFGSRRQSDQFFFSTTQSQGAAHRDPGCCRHTLFWYRQPELSIKLVLLVFNNETHFIIYWLILTDWMTILMCNTYAFNILNWSTCCGVTSNLFYLEVLQTKCYSVCLHWLK